MKVYEISKSEFDKATKYESSTKTKVFAQSKQIFYVLDDATYCQHFNKNTKKSTYHKIDK